jgi:hypothetical protein
MVVVLKTPNPLLQNFFHYDVDLLVVSCDSVPWLGCPFTQFHSSGHKGICMA